MHLKEGEKAPDFTLSDQNGALHTLSDYQGQWILLYFYPKDDTPGCTKEACGIRDHFPDFHALRIHVFGVSVDSVHSHKKFEEKYQLPFTILSDETKEVVQLYGAWGKKNMMGKEYMGTNRISFLIDDKGVIRKIYHRVKPETHAKEVLDDIRKMM